MALQAVTETVTKELEDQQAKNAKLRLENDQTAQTVEHLSLENQQRTSDLKVMHQHLFRKEMSKGRDDRFAPRRKVHRYEASAVELLPTTMYGAIKSRADREVSVAVPFICGLCRWMARSLRTPIKAP